MDLSTIILGPLPLLVPILFVTRPEWLIDNKYVQNACIMFDICSFLPFLGVDNINIRHEHLGLLSLSPLMCFLQFRAFAFLFKLMEGRYPVRYIRGTKDPGANWKDTIFFFFFAATGFISSFHWLIIPAI